MCSSKYCWPKQNCGATFVGCVHLQERSYNTQKSFNNSSTTKITDSSAVFHTNRINDTVIRFAIRGDRTAAFECEMIKMFATSPQYHRDVIQYLMLKFSRTNTTKEPLTKKRQKKLLATGDFKVTSLSVLLLLDSEASPNTNLQR